MRKPREEKIKSLIDDIRYLRKLGLDGGEIREKIESEDSYYYTDREKQEALKRARVN